MRHLTGVLLVAVLALLLLGCEREEPRVEPPETAEETRATQQEETRADAVTEPRETEMEATQEEKAALPVINERIEEEAEQRDQLESKAGEGEVSAEMEEKGLTMTAGEGEMPQTVTYDASFGPVEFKHAMHAGMLDCVSCHETDPPQRIVIDKERAHDMCKGCHQEQGAGPTGCRGCHQKE